MQIGWVRQLAIANKAMRKGIRNGQSIFALQHPNGGKSSCHPNVYNFRILIFRH